MDITVYSTPVCPFCTMAKDFLKARKVKFKELDVSADKKALQEMLRKSSQTGVPVLDIGGKIIVGFDRAAIAKALGLKD